MTICHKNFAPFSLSLLFIVTKSNQNNYLFHFTGFQAYFSMWIDSDTTERIRIKNNCFMMLQCPLTTKLFLTANSRTQRNSEIRSIRFIVYKYFNKSFIYDKLHTSDIWFSFVCVNKLPKQLGCELTFTQAQSVAWWNCCL